MRPAFWFALLGLTGCGRLNYDLLPGVEPADGGRFSTDSQLGAAPIPVVAAPPTFSFTSPSFHQVPGSRIAFDVTASGQYWLIFVSAGLQTSADQQVGPAVRYLLDGQELGVGEVLMGEPSTAPWQHFALVQPEMGSHSVQVEAREPGGLDGAVEQLRVIAVPLPADADVHAAETSSVTVLDEQTTVVALTVSPQTAGDYLVLGVTNAFSPPGGTSAFLQWEYPPGQSWTPVPFRNPRTPQQSFFAATRWPLTAGDHTFRLQGWSGGGDANFRHARLVAVRADAFDAVFSSAPTGMECTTSGEPQSLSGLDTPPSAAPQHHLVIQTLQASEYCGSSDCGVMSLRNSHRLLGFWRDGTAAPLFNHHQGHCGFRLSYGVFRLLQSAVPISLENTFASGDPGFQMVSAKSVIHVLRL